MPHNRFTTLNEMIGDAKSLLREMEHEKYEEQTNTLLERTKSDPLAIYKETKCYPRFVVWELTLACNMRCGHCGSTAGIGRTNELALDEMLRVCDELGELECERLTLLGGEPLIHPHWEKVAGRLQQNGIRVNVITNGWNLPEAGMCDRLAKSGLTIVGISVDGMRKSHDKLRREGSFERIEKGMDLLRERDVPIAVCTVITSDSIQDLNELYDFIVSKGAKVWQIQIASPLGRLRKDDPILIKPEQISQVYDLFYAKRNSDDGISIDLADDVGYYAPWKEGHVRSTRKKNSIWTGCNAGIQILGIDSNGDVKGCQSLPSTPEFIEGNLREQSLKSIWQAPDKFKYNRAFKMAQLSGYCAECKYGSLCKAGCSSAALAYTGTLGENPMCIYKVEMEKRKQSH